MTADGKRGKESDKKLSFEFCKRFLKDKGKDYTDEKISMIRDALYILAELDYLITEGRGFTKGKQITDSP